MDESGREIKERSPPSSAIGGVLRERDDFLQRRRQRRRKRRVPANRARAVELKPGVEATEMEVMAAIGHHSQHFRFSVLTETDRASGGVTAASSGHGILTVLKLRVGIDDALVEADDGVLFVGAVVAIALGDEDDAGENNTVVGGGGIVRVVGIGNSVDGTLAATTDVGREKESGEKDEKSEGDGDGVAKAEVGERRRG